MDKIIMNNMEFWGFHGVMPEEQLKGQPFIIDVVLWLELEKAAKSDCLEHTVSYADLYEKIRHVVEEQKYQLIEALAGAVIEEIFKEDKIKKVQVRVKKPQAPIKGNFNYMAVEMMRERL
jgi:dihydroneopterin aldolase